MTVLKKCGVNCLPQEGISDTRSFKGEFITPKRKRKTLLEREKKKERKDKKMQRKQEQAG